MNIEMLKFETKFLEKRAHQYREYLTKQSWYKDDEITTERYLLQTVERLMENLDILETAGEKIDPKKYQYLLDFRSVEW